jgi:ribonuclease T2
MWVLCRRVQSPEAGDERHLTSEGLERKARTLSPDPLRRVEKMMSAKKSLHSVLLRQACTLALLMLTAAATDARHHHRQISDAQSGQFDYYLLSLSWAPTYCLTHGDDGAECSNKGYGFVLHGLWPQYDGGGYPENCDTQFELTSQAAAKGRTVYPSERLMSHEWQTHGTCSGISALDYFSIADRATAAVNIPAAFNAPQRAQSLTAFQIIALFRRANPQMPDRSMAVACSRDTMSEIRVCLTKDLVVRACGQGVRNSCPKVPLQLPASR